MRARRKHTLLVAVLIFANLALSIAINSSTSIVSLSISVLFFYFFPKKMMKNIYIIILLSSIVISIIVTTSSTLITQNLVIQNLVVNALGKDLTFTGRTYIWARAYRILSTAEKILFGNGFQTAAETSLTLLSVHAHNGWLNFLYRGGILLFSAMFFLCWLTAKNLQNSMYADTYVAKWIGSVYVFYMVWFLTDISDSGTALYMLFIYSYLSFYLDKICTFAPITVSSRLSKMIRQDFPIYGRGY
jgi:O-antigen ligase